VKPSSLLTLFTRDKLLTANLTAAEWLLWTYLASLDPFATGKNLRQRDRNSEEQEISKGTPLS